MKIDNLQVPKGYSKKESSKSIETTEDFSKVLSGTINTSKEKCVKEDIKVDNTMDSDVKDIDVDDDTEISINTLLMFVNMPLTEDEVLNVADLCEEQLAPINIDSTLASSLLDSDTMQIVNTSLINTNPTENFVLEENLIETEILAGRAILDNDEIVKTMDMSDEDRPILKVDSGNRPINHISKQEPDKDFSIDNDFVPSNEVKELNLEELTKTEGLDLVKATEEKVLDIKKDETIKDNKWINHNIGSTQKLNVAAEVEQQAMVVSNENIQNINDSIIQLMETTTEGNTDVMKVQLYPEELGAVNITLKMEDGKLIAKILVDDEYVKQLFTGKIELLNNNLKEQNVNMEEIFVELNTNANSNPNGDSSQNNSNFSNGKGTFKFTTESLDTVTTEEIDLKSGELSILA